MRMLIEAVVEYNDEGYLVHSSNHIGAFVRGGTKEEALSKFEDEISRYVLWATGERIPTGRTIEINIIQEKKSTLDIADADSDILFESESTPIGINEYETLKNLVLKSAKDFNLLYGSIPDKKVTSLKERRTFYGRVPLTAEEMYAHTNRVTGYYFGEIGIRADFRPDIYVYRAEAFKLAEKAPDYLKSPVHSGAFDELWTLRKVMRRFIWHDRIHAKAMYRMAVRIWGPSGIADPFCFGCRMYENGSLKG